MMVIASASSNRWMKPGVWFPKHFSSPRSLCGMGVGVESTYDQGSCAVEVKWAGTRMTGFGMVCIIAHGIFA